MTRRKSPEHVGFQDNLYTTIGFDLRPQTLLEDGFFKIVDQLASDAVDRMFAKPGEPLPPRLRSAFARLVLSLMNRTPDRVADIKARFATEYEILLAEMRKRHAMGEAFELPLGMTFEQTLESMSLNAKEFHWGPVLKNIIDSQLTGPHLMNMRWYLRTITSSKYTFITGDKPVVHSNGLSKPEGNIGLPLGPRSLFVATNSEEVARNILGVPDSFLVSRVNHEIAKSCIAYVYGDDDTQLHFVERRLRNLHPPPTPRPPPGYLWPVSSMTV